MPFQSFGIRRSGSLKLDPTGSYKRVLQPINGYNTVCSVPSADFGSPKRKVSDTVPDLFEPKKQKPEISKFSTFLPNVLIEDRYSEQVNQTQRSTNYVSKYEQRPIEIYEDAEKRSYGDTGEFTLRSIIRPFALADFQDSPTRKSVTFSEQEQVHRFESSEALNSFRSNPMETSHSFRSIPSPFLSQTEEHDEQEEEDEDGASILETTEMIEREFQDTESSLLLPTESMDSNQGPQNSPCRRPAPSFATSAFPSLDELTADGEENKENHNSGPQNPISTGTEPSDSLVIGQNYSENYSANFAKPATATLPYLDTGAIPGLNSPMINEIHEIDKEIRKLQKRREAIIGGNTVYIPSAGSSKMKQFINPEAEPLNQASQKQETHHHKWRSLRLVFAHSKAYESIVEVIKTPQLEINSEEHTEPCTAASTESSQGSRRKHGWRSIWRRRVPSQAT
ncbi:unnamed protein product [Kuraishia capsulata CBS 1993]|uniref:Uncharacterized protein n=1 Tax=Kuraishia capsulata CBS 1993 TaxID=1382522 RepID=W6MSD7_9ASCO|nr:uncharacterized protein KUCA_T00005612001 [Kuraishia capsulata CBS 1993]CDK29619.1 unnamed protein product [Kuraishia capsulata CBS 1993]